MMEGLEPRDWLIGGALAVGLLFGAIARASGFCLRSAVIEAAERRPGPKLAAWLVALPLAAVATQALALTGRLDLGASFYLSSTLSWGGMLLGGLAFGAGMILTRGCGSRHLVLAAGGGLRSWIVLIALGLCAYATLRGVLAVPRVWIEGAASADLGAPGQGLPGLLAGPFGAAPETATIALLAVLVLGAAALLVRIRFDGPVGGSLAAGAGIGLLIAAGWTVTGVLARDDFDPVPLESLSFTAPVGDSLVYLMTYTGARADFAIAVVGGVLAGAFLVAAARRELRLTGFETPGQLARYLSGGALMGFGGVLALGCSIGAGLSGVSTLSLGSLLALGAIVAGAVLTHKVTERAAARTGKTSAGLAE